MTRPLIRPRTCTCCGETKATSAFSWNVKTHAYCPNCRECGQWLTLFIHAFGSPQDREKKREYQAAYERRQKLKAAQPFALQGVWR